MPALKVHSQDIMLSPGDRLVLYSDGITEAENNEQEMFMLERTLTALDDCDRACGAHGLVDKLVSDVTAFAREAEQSDDITILAVDFVGNNPKKQ